MTGSPAAEAGLASLPMYDFPQLRPQTDALWRFIAAHLHQAGIAAPDELTRGPALGEIWTDTHLLLAQTCGYPLVTALKGRVALLATPCYDAPGCDGPHYRSAVIVRVDEHATGLPDMRGRICAVNGADSNSGMNLLRAAVAPLAQTGGPFFGGVVLTGAHLASMRAVAVGAADIAAIDCVTWAHARRLYPAEASALRVLCWTGCSPGLPLITSLATSAPTRRALLGALDEVVGSAAMAPVRAALLLTGFAVLSVADYDAILADLADEDLRF